jgi:hypothetical protein
MGPSVLLYGLVLVAITGSPALSYPLKRPGDVQEDFPFGRDGVPEIEAVLGKIEAVDREKPLHELQEGEHGPEIQLYCGTNRFFVMAFTSGDSSAGSDTSHRIELQLDNDHHTYTADLYDRDGDDMQENKGDLWTLPPSGFNIRGCLTKDRIKKVTIVAGGSDGWKIESIITVLQAESTYKVVTANIHYDAWVEDDVSQHRRVPLFLVS